MIRCVRFDQKNVTNDCRDATTCNRTESCAGPQHSIFRSQPFNVTFDYKPSNYCYAIFKSVGHNEKNPNLVQVGEHNLSAVLSGCNYRFIGCAKNVSSECVLERHSHWEEYYQCCCTGDFCNRNVNMNLLRKKLKHDVAALGK